MNTTHRSSLYRISADHGIESRLAIRLAGALTAGAEQMPHDVSERLRFGREQALQRARELRRTAAAASATAVMGVSSSGTAVLGGLTPWWQRAASVLPLVVLLSGLLAIDKWSTREQMMTAADIDTQLLADDLPPAAFSDPGFAEFIRSAPEK